MKVGVTGHRWNKIERSTLPNLSSILRLFLASLDQRSPGHKTLVCGMAEGTDLCAASVRPMSWELEAILPLEPVRWRAHLTETAGVSDAALFDRLIRGARIRVLARGSDPDYVAAALCLSETIDRLVAVWDGEPGLPGGVAEVVARCRKRGIAVDILPLRLLAERAGSPN